MMSQQQQHLEQQQGRIGLIQEKIHQIGQQVPKTMEQQHIGQPKCQVAQPCVSVKSVEQGKQQEQELCWEKKSPKFETMRQIRELLAQVQGMVPFTHEKPEECKQQQQQLQGGKQCQMEKPVQHEQMMKQIREIQSQIQEISMFGLPTTQHQIRQSPRPETFGWEKRCEQEETMRQIRDLLTQVQDMVLFIQEQPELFKQQQQQQQQQQTVKPTQWERFVDFEQEQLMRQIRDIQTHIQEITKTEQPRLTKPQQQQQQQPQQPQQIKTTKPEELCLEKRVQQQQQQHLPTPVVQQKLQQHLEQPKQQQQVCQQQQQVCQQQQQQQVCQQQQQQVGQQQKQQICQHLKEQKPQFEIMPVEQFFGGEWQTIKQQQQPCEQTWGKQVFIYERRQLIVKLIQQVRILEDLLVEQELETVSTPFRIGQFQFQLVKQLIEQIKKQFVEIESCIGKYGWELPTEQQQPVFEFVQKQKKIFQLLKQQVEQIEKMFFPTQTYETLMQLPRVEFYYKQQVQELLEKVREFKLLGQEFVYYTQQEIQFRIQPVKQQTRDELFTTEPTGQYKLYSLMSLPIFYAEEETFGGKQMEQEKVAPLRRQLEELQLAKDELEMRLYETDKKVEQYRRQIELLEQYPVEQQYRCELTSQYTKPEGELIKITLKQHQPTFGGHQTQKTYF